MKFINVNQCQLEILLLRQKSDNCISCQVEDIQLLFRMKHDSDEILTWSKVECISTRDDERIETQKNLFPTIPPAFLPESLVWPNCVHCATIQCIDEHGQIIMFLVRVLGHRIILHILAEKRFLR